MTEAPERRPLVSLKVLAAVVALATGATTLFLTFRPDLARDPRTTIGAAISSAAVDKHVRRDAYFEVLEPDDADRRRKAIDRFLVEGYLKDPTASKEYVAKVRSSPAWKQVRGSIVYIVAEGHGLKNRDVKVYWYVYNASTRQREEGGQSDSVTLKAPNDRFILPTFVADDENCRQRIFVRLELRDEDNTLLSMDSTKPFRSCPKPPASQRR